jgi:hypothetical protein
MRDSSAMTSTDFFCGPFDDAQLDESFRSGWDKILARAKTRTWEKLVAELAS